MDIARPCIGFIKVVDNDVFGHSASALSIAMDF